MIDRNPHTTRIQNKDVFITNANLSKHKTQQFKILLSTLPMNPAGIL